MYQNPERFKQYIDQLEAYYAEMQNNYSVYNECVLPVLQQSIESVWLLLFFCLVLRILSISGVPRKGLHILSTILGCLSLWKFYKESMIYVCVPALIFMLLYKLFKIPGLMLTLLSGCSMLIW